MSDATKQTPDKLQFFATTENGQPCVKDLNNPGFHSPFMSQRHAEFSAGLMNENEARAAGYFWVANKS